jgi:hypothetical protein
MHDTLNFFVAYNNEKYKNIYIYIIDDYLKL